ncbi:MAG: DUF2935 domain-containing protein [Candidatus Aquicultor sp.]
MAQVKVFKESSLGTIVTRDEGLRPVYLAAMDTTSPNVRALAEVIFWSDQIREHSLFMEMLLPIEDLPKEHERAVMYRGAFEVLYERATQIDLDEDAIRNLSNDFMAQTAGVIRFKRQLEDSQRSGKIHSLLWPLFLDHIAREAQRFLNRQQIFMGGQDIPADRDEIINFWAQIMAEHTAFIAHLLDPTEIDLFMNALKESDTFRRIQKEHGLEGNTDPVVMEIHHVIDFKTAALNGIQTGQIQSIITPALADHVRREAVFFNDELRRADMGMGVQPKAA